jgi:hypothetical protein
MPDQAKRLVSGVSAAAKRSADCGEFFLVPANADTENESVGAQLDHRRGLFRDHEWIPQRQDEHRCAQRNAIRDCRDGRQRDQRIVDASQIAAKPVREEKVIRHSHTVVPKRLRPNGGIDQELWIERRVFGGQDGENFQSVFS